VRVFNLTDIPTKVLEQRGLVQQSIAVARRMVNPGEFVEVEDLATTRDGLQYLLQVGALSIDAMPPAYLKARQVLQADPARSQLRVPLQHVEVQETAVAGTVGALLAEGDQVDLSKHDPLAGEADAVVPPVVEASSSTASKAGKGKRR
jgi:hypothetical protein